MALFKPNLTILTFSIYNVKNFLFFNLSKINRKMVVSLNIAPKNSLFDNIFTVGESITITEKAANPDI